MSSIKYTESFDIKTALKIIRHISSGIYRDLGGSLKELVTNSFDAQATEVTIWSGAPKFDTIVVEDNGNGITEDVLHKAFENIGLSTKVTHPEWYEGKHERPLIGRFGIGFLSSAHISRDILLRSFTHRDKSGLEIHMDLEPYFRHMNEISTGDEYEFGSVEYAHIENTDRTRGTTVVLRGVKTSEFHSLLSESGDDYVDWPVSGTKAKADGLLMKKFVEGIHSDKVHALPTLSGRNQLLWHLGMTTPVRYLPGGPVVEEYLNAEARRLIEKLQSVAEGFDFRVWFDGVEIRKPLLLPTPKLERSESEESDVGIIDDYQVWPIRYSGVAENGHKVRAEGYLFFQPYRIIPVESRGLLPRVDAVGVGATLDNTFLSNLKAESPLFRVQVSGELYIIEGLAEALDLDRSGFLQVDSEFRLLLKGVGDVVYSFVREAAKVRRGRSRRLKRQKEAVNRDQRIVQLGEMLRNSGLTLSIVPSSQPSMDRYSDPDYKERSSYPKPKPRIVIEHKEKRARVELDIDDPDWLATVALADRLLGTAPNGSDLRREFASGLSAIRAAKKAAKNQSKD